MLHDHHLYYYYYYYYYYQKERTNREENEKESEYNLGTKERVDINDLMASLGDTAEFGELKKKLGNLKEQPLSAPLSDLSKNRLLRKVLFPFSLPFPFLLKTKL